MGQRCQLNRNGTLMNKSLPVIRVRTRRPLLVRHVSGFLCLAAAQRIIIGRGSGRARGGRTARDIIPRTRQEPRLGGRPRPALGIIPEISGGAIRGAARSFRSHSPRDRRRGIARRCKYGCAECALKRDAAANDSFVRSPAARISIVFQIGKRSVLPREVSVRASIAL